VFAIAWHDTRTPRVVPLTKTDVPFARIPFDPDRRPGWVGIKPGGRGFTQSLECTRTDGARGPLVSCSGPRISSSGGPLLMVERVLVRQGVRGFSGQ
jgi:hypothetical protein